MIKKALAFASKKRKVSVLVLGFYDRSNAGDELYKLAIPRCFEGCGATFEFACVDDAHRIPEGIDIVIFGGGDIINGYFMKKAERLLSGYAGPCYAFSVGVPYASEARYLRLFDHAFVRSRGDYETAVSAVGARNVTYLPDAAFSLAPSGSKQKANSRPFRVAVCLAQPAFYGNARSDALFEAIARAIAGAKRRTPTLRACLISFNASSESEREGDAFANAALAAKMREIDAEFEFEFDEARGARELFDRIADFDAAICMRYHSLVFSVLHGVPAIAVYCSPKVKRFAADFPGSVFEACELETDAAGLPVSIPRERIEEAICRAARSGPLARPSRPDWTPARRAIFEKRRKAAVLCRPSREPWECALERCRSTLARYLGDGPEAFERRLSAIGALDAGGRRRIDVARVACYCATRSLQSPCVWGFAENSSRGDFRLLAALRYAWEVASDRVAESERYFPETGCERLAFANVDASSTADFASYHRSGWAYAVGGLMSIDAASRGRTSDVTIDAYVDRTFHWGLDALRASGSVPYRSAWIGFVHHTFDQTHSEYNCVELFKKREFLESLECCGGLIALTEYLAEDLRVALAAVGFARVPVRVVPHPMEDVAEKFEMRRFLSNGDRRVVQIGAWLRNAYAIYDLRLSKNRLSLRKAALKGKEMDGYFKPKGFLESARKFLREAREGSACVSGSVVSASEANKYCEGLSMLIEENDKSVEIIERLSNEEYDSLLSRNIVFLNLVDCSAVNTALECLFRHTPIVVNRHPALEEALGEEYPGFYEDSFEATAILNDASRIEAAHVYLKKRDTSRHSLDYFVLEVQKAVLLAKRFE